MSTGLTINRQNGNVPKSVAGKDHVSGLIAYLLSTEVPEAFKTAPVQGVSTIDKAEQLGITADAKAAWSIRVLHYQLSEILRVNKGITLYLGIFAKPDTHTFAEIKTMQHYALGEIRQIGIWDGTTALTPQNIVAIQNVADSLDEENAPPFGGLCAQSGRLQEAARQPCGWTKPCKRLHCAGRWRNWCGIVRPYRQQHACQRVGCGRNACHHVACRRASVHSVG